MQLSEADRKTLNEVYTRAYRKYFAYSGIENFKPISYAEALESAREALEEYYNLKRSEINAKYADRILEINTEAAKRGLLASTVVLQQIEKAEYDRTVMLSKFESVTDEKVRAEARRILSDNMTAVRLSVQADKNSLDMFYKETSGGVLAADKQRAVDEEVYAEYLKFLLEKTPEDAAAYVSDDPLFYYNLSPVYFDKLAAETERRV